MCQALSGSEHYAAAVRWNEYDQAAFDPAYPSLPLSAFAPALRRVLGRDAFWWNSSHLKKLAVTGTTITDAILDSLDHAVRFAIDLRPLRVGFSVW